VEDIPPTRPSLLSRLIARSSILHPPTKIPQSRPSIPVPTRSSPWLHGPKEDNSDISSRIPINLDDRDLSDEIENARSRRISNIFSLSPAWSPHNVELDDLPEDLSTGSFPLDSPSRSFSRESMPHDHGRPTSLTQSKSSKSETSIPSPRLSTSQLLADQSIVSSESRYSHPAEDKSQNPSSLKASHSFNNSSSTNSTDRHSTTQIEDDRNPDPVTSSETSQTFKASSTEVIESESSLRRSTSQRVIGFFSDLLRSTSSRTISDLGPTPQADSSMSGRVETEDQEEQNHGGQGDYGDTSQYLEYEQSKESRSL
jgi:hypothetical protein